MKKSVVFSIGSTITKKWRRYTCIRWLFSCDWKPKTIDNNVTKNWAQPKAMKRFLNSFWISFQCLSAVPTHTHTSIWVIALITIWGGGCAYPQQNTTTNTQTHTQKHIPTRLYRTHSTHILHTTTKKQYTSVEFIHK